MNDSFHQVDSMEGQRRYLSFHKMNFLSFITLSEDFFCLVYLSVALVN